MTYATQTQTDIIQHYGKNLICFNHCLRMEGKIIAITKISPKRTSFRITLPTEVAERIRAEAGDFIAFYENNGEIIIRKIE